MGSRRSLDSSVLPNPTHVPSESTTAVGYYSGCCPPNSSTHPGRPKSIRLQVLRWWGGNGNRTILANRAMPINSCGSQWLVLLLPQPTQVVAHAPSHQVWCMLDCSSGPRYCWGGMIWEVGCPWKVELCHIPPIIH